MILTAALLVILILLLLSVALMGPERVPWANDLRRVGAGVRGRAEWMASEEVVAAVTADYMEAMNWLRDTAYEHPLNPAAAASYLTDAELERYRSLAAHRTTQSNLTGVLRASHQVKVRRFNENGDHCIVVDYRRTQQMVTYSSASGRRIATQALGDAMMVYEMAYDTQDRRWKVARFVQQLPRAWQMSEHAPFVRMQIEPLQQVGRGDRKSVV